MPDFMKQFDAPVQYAECLHLNSRVIAYQRKVLLCGLVVCREMCHKVTV